LNQIHGRLLMPRSHGAGQTLGRHGWGAALAQAGAAAALAFHDLVALLQQPLALAILARLNLALFSVCFQ